jgi:hypothetical protein
VYSTEEPKGMDCIEKFQGMQECFKEHPDVYKGELDEEDDEGEYDEAMAAEKEELVKEIKERREKLGIEADGTSQKRLLEESPSPARESKLKAKPQSKKAASSTTTDSEASSPKKPAPEAKTTTEGLLADKEDINEGQKSSTIRKPNPPPAGPTSDEGQEVIPKAAHDASGAKSPNDKKPKP